MWNDLSAYLCGCVDPVDESPRHVHPPAGAAWMVLVSAGKTDSVSENVRASTAAHPRALAMSAQREAAAGVPLVAASISSGLDASESVGVFDELENELALGFHLIHHRGLASVHEVDAID